METFKDDVDEMVNQLSSILRLKDGEFDQAVRQALEIMANWGTDFVIGYVEAFTEKMKAVPPGNDYAKGFTDALSTILQNLKGYFKLENHEY